MATIYQVSALAGVSLATVSRVINKNARVSDTTRKKVQAAMKELGYRPNAIARSLASNRSDSIGILVSELYGPFYGDMMSGIEARLRTAEKHVIIAAGHSDEQREKDGIEFLVSRKCDALILHVEAVSDEYLIELSKGSIPIVLINRVVPELADVCISLNNEQGGYLATRAVLEQGHRQLAYIAGPLWKTDVKNRLAGHRRALAEFGIEFSRTLLFEGNYGSGSGSEGLCYLLAQQQPFSALICANDEMAAGAMKCARKQQLHIPQNLSIVGFDNIVIARYLYPTLSTIDYPIQAMGQMAAALVLKKIYRLEPQTPICNIFDPRLISRDSVQAITPATII